MRSRSLLPALGLCCLAGTAFAGPNAGGVILIHAEPGLIWTNELDVDYCGLSTTPSCSDVVYRVDGGPGFTVSHVLAAFPPTGEPRVAGVTMGLVYDPAEVLIAGWGECGDFELHTGGWPAPNEGIAITWGEAQTDHVLEVAWFATYTYGDPTTLGLRGHPSGGGNFADDDVPSNIDAIADYGILGFNTDGDLPCGSCTLSLSPSAVTVYQPGDGTFPVELNVADVDQLGRFEACLGHDPGLVEFIDQTIDETFLGSTGRDVFPWDPIPCASECGDAGWRIAASTTGSEEGPSGSGTLAEIRFRSNGDAGGSSTVCLDAIELEDTEDPENVIWVAAASGIEMTHSAYCFGDFTADGDVTVFDLAQNIPRWGTCAGDPSYVATYDVNLLEEGNFCASTPDGCINVIDIQRVAGRWHLGCETAPAPGRNGQAERGGGATVRISPESQVINGAVGQEFTVVLSVDDVTDLGGFEATLSYDPSVVHVLGVNRSEFPEVTGRTAYSFANDIDNDLGTVRFGACSVGLDGGAAGTGDLVEIRFEIQDCEVTTDLVIEDVLLTYVDGAPQPVISVTDGSLEVQCATDTPTIPMEPGIALTHYPNPVFDSAEFRFRVPDDAATSDVSLEVFDTAGRRIQSLVHDRLEPGEHRAQWDTRSGDRDVASGTYFARLRVGEEERTVRVVVAKR